LPAASSLIGLLTLMAVPQLALAQVPALEQGVEAFNTGEFRRSLRLLRQAVPSLQDAEALGRAQLYIGLNQAYLGQKAQARQAFESALAQDPTLVVDPVQIKPDVVQLFRTTRASVRGQLSVEGGAPGSVVLVDGARRGAAPLTLTLPVGRHHVQLADSAGSVQHRQWVVVYHGRLSQVRVKARAPRADVPVFKPGPTRRPRVVSPPPLPPVETPPSRRRLWTWVAAGGAVVVSAVGLGLVLSGSSDHEEYLTTYDCERFKELEGSIPRKYTASHVMFGLGGALAATAVVLYVLEGRRGQRIDDRVGLVIGSAGGLRLSF